MGSHTFRTLIRRLSHAGFSRDFLVPAILPDWWDESCENDAELLTDLEVRVARFLQQPIADVRDPSFALEAPIYERAQLRRVHDIDRDRLGPAIYTALQIAGAAVRSLRSAETAVAIPPLDPLVWRQEVKPLEGPLGLEDVLADLWGRGIPVIPVDVLPAPSFQGLACIVENRPVILLGHKIEQPGRVAFFVAHEVGHIVAGDCGPDQPVVDEEDEIVDDSDMERKADLFAMRFMAGGDTIPEIVGTGFKELANKAHAMECELGVDAGVLLFAWARRHGDYAAASMALKALYRASGARRALRDYVDRYLNIDAATETDRNLLRCIYASRDQKTPVD